MANTPYQRASIRRTIQNQKRLLESFGHFIEAENLSLTEASFRIQEYGRELASRKAVLKEWKRYYTVLTSLQEILNEPFSVAAVDADATSLLPTSTPPNSELIAHLASRKKGFSDQTAEAMQGIVHSMRIIESRIDVLQQEMDGAHSICSLAKRSLQTHLANKKKVEELLSQHRGLVHPINNVPEFVLRSIFTFVAESYFTSPTSAATRHWSPLSALGSVSRAWRRIVHDTPALTRYHTIHIGSGVPRSTAGINNLLRHAKVPNIHLRIDEIGTIPNIVKALASLSSQLRTSPASTTPAVHQIHLNLTTSNHVVLHNALALLPTTKELILSRPPIVSENTLLHLDSKDLQHLERLEVVNWIPRLLQPAPALKSLTISGSKGADADYLRSVLQYAPNLTELSVDGECGPALCAGQFWPALEHAKIQVLRTTFEAFSTSLSGLQSNYTFASLSHIILTKFDCQPTALAAWKAFALNANHSNNISRLDILSMSMPSAQDQDPAAVVADFLRYIPSLDELYLEGMAVVFVVSALWQNARATVLSQEVDDILLPYLARLRLSHSKTRQGYGKTVLQILDARSYIGDAVWNADDDGKVFSDLGELLVEIVECPGISPEEYGEILKYSAEEE